MTNKTDTEILMTERIPMMAELAEELKSMGYRLIEQDHGSKFLRFRINNGGMWGKIRVATFGMEYTNDLPEDIYSVTFEFQNGDMRVCSKEPQLINAKTMEVFIGDLGWIISCAVGDKLEESDTLLTEIGEMAMGKKSE